MRRQCSNPDGGLKSSSANDNSSIASSVNPVKLRTLRTGHILIDIETLFVGHLCQRAFLGVDQCATDLDARPAPGRMVKLARQLRVQVFNKVLASVVDGVRV